MGDDAQRWSSVSLLETIKRDGVDSRVFTEKELDRGSTVAFFATVQNEGGPRVLINLIGRRAP
jgi:hypothetical protein